MNRGFDDEDGAGGFHCGSHLAAELFPVGDFMHHVEEECEVGLDGQVEIGLGGSVEDDALLYGFVLYLLLYDVQHALLEVGGYGSACIAGEFCHGDGEEARATANVYGYVAFLYVPAEDLLRVVDELPEGVVKASVEGYRAYSVISSAHFSCLSVSPGTGGSGARVPVLVLFGLFPAVEPAGEGFPAVVLPELPE